jgi:hypothetical protein
LFFVKLFGCMLAEAKANGYVLPIDLNEFSKAIMSGRPHSEVHLQFGRCDGIVGRTNLHLWTTDPGESVLAAWLYELGSVAVNVHFVQAGRFEHRHDLWHPSSHTSSRRFKIADFCYSRRAPPDGEGANASESL